MIKDSEIVSFAFSVNSIFFFLRKEEMTQLVTQVNLKHLKLLKELRIKTDFPWHLQLNSS